MRWPPGCGAAAEMHTVQIVIRDPNFKDICRQKRLEAPTYVSRDIAQACMELMHAAWSPRAPVRALTVTAQNLVEEGLAAEQLNLFAAGPRPAGTSWSVWSGPWTVSAESSAGAPFPWPPT